MSSPIIKLQKTITSRQLLFARRGNIQTMQALYSAILNILLFYMQAGANLAIGLVNAGFRSEIDPAKALLSETIEDSKQRDIVRISAIVG